ncbi:hypothetical protein [Alicyclobacillus mengziensis]|uniref:Uncharacterized protein n=1 Tax=Alicyclobacillus mengziensis TaxID=2931921 RepID=A0A9X7Z894_9BACL|nr:hypothetical protein [Alicyclobacillus mengziensis]QSO49382.1 hypothetical protein JZ786_10925 [Alicyclobacillus mengziensis]
MRVEVQQTIMKKAFRENKSPFVRDADAFHWSGTTTVTSKNTGITYDVEVEVSLTTNSRLTEQMSACLLKAEGVRMEDLLIAEMIDPKLQGSIDIKGLPKDKIETNLSKFIKKVSKPAK